MTASQKAEFNQRTLMALLTPQAEHARLEETIRTLARSLADVSGIPASYPPGMTRVR